MVALGCMTTAPALFAAPDSRSRDATINANTTQPPGTAGKARILADYGKLPLSFEVNQGQADAAVRYLSRGQGYALFLTKAEAVLRLSGPQHESSIVRWEAAGGNPHPRVQGESPLPTQSNYFLGNDPHRWQTGIAHYSRIRYQEIYPGVDLIYRGNQRQLEYDFVIAPGADPGRIRLSFRGADSISIEAGGDLILHTANGNVVQHAPEIYQEAGGKRERVSGRYVLGVQSQRANRDPGAPREVAFAVGRYDRKRPLIIDPVLVYSTFLGGSDFDNGRAIAVDGAGNGYIAGETASITFPGVNAGSIQPAFGGGSFDPFVTKINAAGTAIVYSTYLGGNGFEKTQGLAVDAGGNAYVTGQTTSPTFPGVTAGSIQPANGGAGDVFVTKINAAGTAIVYSTFLGGGGEDSGGGITVDGTGSAYVTGFTKSSVFPGVNAGSIQPTFGGIQDAFVTKINPTGTAIVYSTFLGAGGADGGVGIAVDGTGNTYVTGFTNSSTFPGVNAGSIQPTLAGGGDAFVIKINAAGTATAYSTFLGGRGSDVPAGIAVDGAGNAVIAGTTESSNFPGVNAGSIQPAYGGGSRDSFVTKINATGTAIAYSTYLGGTFTDFGHAVAVDGAGNAYVAGTTESLSFPGVNGSSIQPVHGGGLEDAFVTMINPAGTAIVFSTYLGGGSLDEGQGIAVDGPGNVYVTGNTESPSFPGVNAGSIQPAHGGGSFDAFVTKIGPAKAATLPFTCSLQYEVSTQDASLSNTPRDRVCTAEIVFALGGGSTSRSYSCIVLAKTPSCTKAIEPGASGVPAGFRPIAVVTAPLYSQTEETNGCTYAILNPTRPPQLYPSAQVVTTPSLAVNIIHRFDCTSRP